MKKKKHSKQQIINLSYDVESGSEITPCDKSTKQYLVY